MKISLLPWMMKTQTICKQLELRTKNSKPFLLEDQMENTVNQSMDIRPFTQKLKGKNVMIKEKDEIMKISDEVVKEQKKKFQDKYKTSN